MGTYKRLGLGALKAGEHLVVPSGDDPIKTMGYIGRSINYYKAKGAEFTMQPVAEGFKVTCIVAPPPSKAADPKRKTMRTLRAKRGGMSTTERAFWRAAYLKMMDRLPQSQAMDTLHDACAKNADKALQHYRDFVERHELVGPVGGGRTEEGEDDA